MKTIPLTVLVQDGPIARAYLSRMRRAELRPSAILLMVYSHHPDSRKPVGGWLPKSVRRWYADRYQEISSNYWPRRIRKTHPVLFDSMVKELGNMVEEPVGLLTEMLGRYRYSDYADQVRRVLVRGLRDEALLPAIKEAPHPTVLFTGGGIVPSSMLSLPGFRFLHVHPGRLPNVRGADGILWSTLVRGGPSASCYYMAEDIDTGPVVSVQDFSKLTFHLPSPHRPDDQVLYRALFSYYDPLLRAEMLTKVLIENGDLASAPAQQQDHSQAITYHFMHTELRREALKCLFVSV